MDLIEEGAKTGSLRWVDHFDEGYAALEMQTEGKMRPAILALRAQANAVGECRFEAIEIGARHIDALIGHETSQVLPDALRHESSLAMVHVEIFFEQDSGNVRGEALRTFLEGFVS